MYAMGIVFPGEIKSLLRFSVRYAVDFARREYPTPEGRHDALGAFRAGVSHILEEGISIRDAVAMVSSYPDQAQQSLYLQGAFSANGAKGAALPFSPEPLFREVMDEYFI